VTTWLGRRFAVVAVLPVVLIACSSSSESSSPATQIPATGGQSLSGGLNVFAAASLTGALMSAKASLESTHPGLKLTVNLAASNTLVTQIEQGAPADVFASADQKNMDALVKAGLVDSPRTFAKNKLEIAVAPGNPHRITSLHDLAGPGLVVVLEAPGVPAGDYTHQVQQRLGITITPMSLAPDVKTAVTEVASGEADATVVFVTDVAAAGTKVTGVTIPDDLQPEIAYPIAVVKASHNPAAAEAFVRSAVSGQVHQALLAQGFIAP
jgi:molybdate transport system substrate-binding protein